jgi:hypothetical protein
MPGVPEFPALTPSRSPSVSRTPTPTPTTSETTRVGSSPSVTPSITPSITRTPSVTPSVTPSITITPSISRTPAPTITPSPSVDCSEMAIFTQMQQAALQFMKTDVAYYKLNLYQTKRNIYGESLEKWYYEPFLIKCTIEREADVIVNEMFGPDVTKAISLTIPRTAWETTQPENLVKGANLLPEIGDIVFDRSTERYYEINNIISDYIPVNTNIGFGQSNCPQAELVTYNMECNQTRVSRLNLLPYKIL